MEMLIQKDWRVIAQPSQLGSLLDRVLISRGLMNEQDRNLFLNVSIDRLHDPFLMAGMDVAVARLMHAIDDHEKILIHGDYDVDGLTATALLVRLLRSMGASVSYLIPDRMTEGYGISWSGVKQAADSGVTLLLTVDCGVSAALEIDRLLETGVETIVTDHHECPEQLPAALAILNPRLPKSQYPFNSLSGVGVAYKLAQALCIEMGCPGHERAFLDLAAIGTIADVVPLSDENRTMAAHGLLAIQNNPRAGIGALLTASGLAGKPVTSITIGYSIAPRLNAAGRMGDATRALDLLLTDDPQTAASLAEALIAVNKDRQVIEAAIFNEAIEEIDRQQDYITDGLIVIARENWHSGVIGIVAARLAEHYQRPTIVLAGEDNTFKGSGRSYGSFDLLAAIRSAANYTIRYGGHRKAAGMTVSAEQLPAFRRELIRYGMEHIDFNQLRPTLLADLTVEPDELTFAAALELEQMMPFGEDNRQPAFILKDARLIEIRPVGNGRHIRIRLQVERPGKPHIFYEGIGFGLGETDEIYSLDDQVDVFFHLEINRFNGQERLSLQIRDIRPADSAFEPQNAAIRAPEQADFRIVYQYLSSQFGLRPVIIDLSILSRRIARNYKVDLDKSTLKAVLHIFEDAGLLLCRILDEDRVRLQLSPTGSEKIRLQDVPAYRKLIAQGSEA